MDQLRLVVAFLWEVMKRLYALVVKIVPLIWKAVKFTAILVYGVFLVMWGALIPEMDNMASAIEYNLLAWVPITIQDYLKGFSKVCSFLIVLFAWILLSYSTTTVCGAIVRLWR